MTFLPQKYWAVAIPIYLSVAFFLFVFIVYPSLGMLITPSLNDVRNITDEKTIYSGKQKNFELGSYRLIKFHETAKLKSKNPQKNLN